MRQAIFAEINVARKYECANGAEDDTFTLEDWLKIFREDVEAVEFGFHTRAHLIGLAEAVVAAIEVYDRNGGFPCGTSTP